MMVFSIPAKSLITLGSLYQPCLSPVPAIYPSSSVPVSGLLEYLPNVVWLSDSCIMLEHIETSVIMNNGKKVNNIFCREIKYYFVYNEKTINTVVYCSRLGSRMEMSYQYLKKNTFHNIGCEW